MALEQLWAGWRHDYVARATEEERQAGRSSPGGCVFCRLGEEPSPSPDNLIVWRGRRVAAALNIYPYGTGHLLLLPVAHGGSLADLDPETSAELWQATVDATTALERAYQPDGINLGANLGRAAGAGIPAHLHLHALPRWWGDTSFMTSVAGTRVLPEPLPVTWEKLRAAWPA